MISSNKYLITTIILSLIPVILIAFIIKPAISSIVENKNKIKKQHEKFRELLNQDQGTQRARSNFNLVKSDMKSVINIFLKTGQELDFITTLEQAANKNNISQDIIFNNQNSTVQGDIAAIPVQLKSSGSFENIISYISGMEALDYYINFDSINIVNTGQNQKILPHQMDENKIKELGTSNISLILTGTTYWKTPYAD